MADSVQIRIDGVEELRRAMDSAAKEIRTKAVRNALRKGARVIAAEARAAAPVLAVATPTRKVGTVKRAIAVRTSKFAKQKGDEGVFVGVRPLRGSRQKTLGKAGAKNPNDPFYWRFLEFGTRKMTARPFLAPAARRGEQAVKIIIDDIVPQINRLNAKAGL